MARAFIASERRSGCSDRLAWLATLLCGLAAACNTFDDPGDDAVPPSSGFTPPVTVHPPTFPGTAPGMTLVPPPPQPGMVGPPDLTGDSGFGAVPCVPCGSLCNNCGGGCMCEPGGKPDMRDPWNSPFEANGADGWRHSSELLCAGFGEVWGTDLVRQGASLYVMVHGIDKSQTDLDLPDADAGLLDETRSIFTSQTTRILQNEGTGWSLRADLIGMTPAQHMAALGSSLLLYGNIWEGRLDGCTLATLREDRFSCEDLGNVQQLYPVSETSAFALINATHLIAFDGDSWQPLPNPLNNLAQSLWADREQIVIGAGGGVIGRRSVGDDPWAFTKTGGSGAVTALWGQSASDLWAGDEQSHLLHFDGASWSTIADLRVKSSCRRRSPVLGILAVGPDIWAYTATQLARWDGTTLETLGDWSCAAPDATSGEHIDRVVSGSRGDDVFVSLSNSAPTASCGSAFVLYYDGKTFHRF